ncbi:MAG TPA: flagellar basal body P-ring formation chaperone FlgA [Acetobacteraceae bacterium]|nr:flagellar basal body P-ring formation chaperone FlgA [Acetobacteraceae bacterium]
MRRAFLAPLALLMLAGPALRAGEAATLRSFGILVGPEVRLGDLFDGIGAAGAQVLGPGPEPGQSITVPAAQAAAIAAQFGIDWHPRSPEDEAVLERPGRPLRRAEVEGPLHAALAAAGAPGRFRIVLPDFSPPEVPPGVAVDARVKELDYDPGSGQFSSVIQVLASGMDPLELPLAGRAEETLRVLVASHVLMPGTVIVPGDLGAMDVPASAIVEAVATSPAQADGMEAHNVIAAGDPIPLADLVPPPLVERGQPVMVALTMPGLALSEQGRALDTGTAGEEIRVLNPVSRAVLEGTVSGPGQVRVAVGSLPLAMPARGRAPGYSEYAVQ